MGERWSAKRRSAIDQLGGCAPSVADRVVVAAHLDPYLSLRALAAYSSMSVRKLRDCLREPNHPLPHFRVGDKILVRQSEFDAWMGAYRDRQALDVDRLVDELLDAARPR